MSRLEDAPRPRRGRLARGSVITASALVTVLASTATGAYAVPTVDLPAESPSSICQEDTVTSVATADTWLDESRPFAAHGGDSVLDVNAGSVVGDMGLASGRARGLVKFPLPSAVPPGCVVKSAKLVLFSPEESAGTKVEVVRLASTWSESQVSWSNQPAETGTIARRWSRRGSMRWNVTPQVEAMLGGANHGFVIRDAAEDTEGGGAHRFYSTEQGEYPPTLVITFSAPPSDEPGAPAPPTPASVTCGEVLTRSTLVTNDLSDCPGDGLVVGADRIIVDLDGHLIDGVGLGSGILNDGHDLVTIRNGAVQQFDYGARLSPDTESNTIEELTLRRNQVAAVELFDVADSEIRGNDLDQNGGGVLLASGTRNVLVADNAVSENSGAGLLVVDSAGNRLENNTVTGGGDSGIVLERATGNTLLGNKVSHNSDSGIEIRAASHGNQVESNTVTESGYHGILVRDSDGNHLTSNIARRMSDSGITLDTANDSVVRGNDVRFNTSGLQVAGSSRNLLVSNNASNTTGIGIELGDDSFQNDLVRNTAIKNRAHGIYIADDDTGDLGNPIAEMGNILRHNNASANLADGIMVARGGSTLTANIANNNSGWGINAAAATIDGSGNVATVNRETEQCVGVVCQAKWDPPEPTPPAPPTPPTPTSPAPTPTPTTTTPPATPAPTRTPTTPASPATALTNTPAQAASVAYGSTSGVSAYAKPGGLVVAGRDNYQDQAFKDVSAAGGTVLIYIDPIIDNPHGRYHQLLNGASVCGPATSRWPGNYQANNYGYLNDFRVGSVLQQKFECVLETMVQENPHMAGWFADDLGSRSWFPGFDWGAFPDKQGYRDGAIALTQTLRKVANKYRLMVMVNGTWSANDGGGYPNAGTHGNALADGGFVEKHDGRIGFFGPYGCSSQWAAQSPVTNGKAFNYALTTSSAGTAEYVNSGCYAYVNQQSSYGSTVAPWGSSRATGLPSRVTQ